LCRVLFEHAEHFCLHCPRYNTIRYNLINTIPQSSVAIVSILVVLILFVIHWYCIDLLCCKQLYLNCLVIQNIAYINTEFYFQLKRRHFPR
jgi:hypothetical protein